MTDEYVFISDYFSNEIRGGGELSDSEIIEILSKDNSVFKVRSVSVDPSFLKKKIKNKFIISNFLNLPKRSKLFLQENCQYIIYEHDHKYLQSRNPAKYKNFIAPKSEIINFSFYKNARKVFCQSNFHKNIINSNLQLDNLYNLSGNMWADSTLDLLATLFNKKKTDKCSIMESDVGHKNTKAAVAYCNHKNLEYELIPPNNYHSFLDAMSNNKTLVFFPKTPETLSRIVVECRMMGMRVITNKLVGAASEPWFELKGPELISFMKNKKKEVVLEIQGSFEND